ncbi:biotin--[acetyl-CoA-carboxylase] ligase [Tenacibaculum sp. M341]|uniref:biotin--[acetyl-CoA-carboxylase] ligase n=1 Tax=Tenacibaculum sp. M341 TaxID=2530339 RepID=UPI001049F587|nr:biotin--[acetyl-CoA-carboxylase] ligase [Tenacibaculum sp. M341]TCI85415.1 biotin--[acetyl-CoA-carboxylase] ligase [Tenacibaculum sp. M341]
MILIKLDATESTNSFLKNLSVKSEIKDFTVVTTNNQTSGRGQMNTTWVSEVGKNLIFSVFVKHNQFKIIDQPYLNFAVSVAIYEALKSFDLPKLSVKWPNDILSEKNKICGVLIENNLKGSFVSSSIIGIGLNVNQIDFGVDLPNASSLKKITNKEIDLDQLLVAVINSLKSTIDYLRKGQFQLLERKYLEVLFKKNVPSMFKDAQNIFFMGKIIGVNTQNGKLKIELDDETIKEYALKEVSFA